MYHCFSIFKQSPLDFFKLVDSRLMLMLLYDSLNLCADSVLSYRKTKLLSAMCLVAINILLRWKNTSIMLSIDMQFMLDEEKLQFLTWCPSGLTPWQIW